jgi:hypothetical protein
MGIKFRRQFPVGSFVLDFYAEELGLGIELDGRFHRTRAGKLRDRVRDRWLMRKGIRILRIPNHVIRETPSLACDLMRQAITNEEPTPSTHPPAELRIAPLPLHFRLMGVRRAAARVSKSAIRVRSAEFASACGARGRSATSPSGEVDATSSSRNSR